MQVLAEARRIVNILDREDGQRRRVANADSNAFAAATALYSMAHKVANSWWCTKLPLYLSMCNSGGRPFIAHHGNEAQPCAIRLLAVSSVAQAPATTQSLHDCRWRALRMPGQPMRPSMLRSSCGSCSGKLEDWCRQVVRHPIVLVEAEAECSSRSTLLQVCTPCSTQAWCHRACASVVFRHLVFLTSHAQRATQHISFVSRLC